MPAVLITGASSGIGLATVGRFASRGWSVAATMRRPEDVAGKLQEGPRLALLRLDVEDSESIVAAVDAALTRFGRLEAVVNNAGYAQMGPLEAMTGGEIERQFAVNVFGGLAVAKAVIPHMRANRSGVIVNVTSTAGKIAFPLSSLYNGSKFAMEGTSESLQFELAPFGIRVKIVEPGGTRTDFIRRSNSWAEHPAYAAQIALMKRVSAGLEQKDLPGPEPVAETIFRAVTDGSSRLRYPVNHRPYLTVRRLVSDGMWRRIAGRMLRQHASS